ncbi:unnamed protein product [Amoebophrya sp. A25]|nr:unnamed protein product [Amoebophrya sp. A25]|eukprot:GSA25T00008665001.1
MDDLLNNASRGPEAKEQRTSATTSTRSARHHTRNEKKANLSTAVAKDGSNNKGRKK